MDIGKETTTVNIKPDKVTLEQVEKYNHLGIFRKKKSRIRQLKAEDLRIKYLIVCK